MADLRLFYDVAEAIQELLLSADPVDLASLKRRLPAQHHGSKRRRDAVVDAAGKQLIFELHTKDRGWAIPMNDPRERAIRASRLAPLAREYGFRVG